MKKIYFAHPVNIYGQPLETALEIIIAHHLANNCFDLIENPNQPKHQVGYDNYAKRKKESGLNHKGMSYFYDEVLPNCFCCAAVTFLDRRMGLGVAGEAKWFLEKGLPVWLVQPFPLLWAHNYSELFVMNPLSGLFYVRPLVDSEEIEMVLTSDPKLVVSHEETRLRTWNVYNREKRSYEEAHRVKMPVPEGFYPEG